MTVLNHKNTVQHPDFVSEHTDAEALNSNPSRLVGRPKNTAALKNNFKPTLGYRV